jgi:hypothetical protein
MVGTGNVPGGAGRFVGCAPGSDDTGGLGRPGEGDPGVTVAGAAAAAGAGAGAGASGSGAMSGGGPDRPMFCCVPM